MKMLKWLIPAVCGSILTFIALYCTWRKKLRIKASMRNIKKLLLNVFTRPREYKSSNDKRYKKLGFWCYTLQRHIARLKRQKKEEVNVESGHGLANTITHSRKYGDAIDKIEKRLSQIHRFSFACIETATHYFSARNKLGEGGFGPVYKGELPGGKEVAIKRLSRSSGQGLVEFKNEILLIAKLQHNNLVRLIGYCSQGKEMMLVYEYMPNKSLDHFLFDPKRSKLLKWTQRVNIIEGVAQGLLYLHKHSRLRVIHRDLKASNILLDQNMNPKISDFGLAKIFQKQDLETNTNTIVGTKGYMSPEYLTKGTVSAKTDVFSFGVLVLEIICGKRNRDSYHSERPLNLIGLAWELWMEGRCLELIDTTTLEISTQKNKVNRCITIGLLCVQDNAADRPSMTDVVSMLTSEMLPLPTPKQPAFFIKTSTHKVNKEGTSNKNCTNSMSISVMEAR